ncbi:MAG: DUF3379 family protein [Betaproteobacteria bacterium]|nr:DUF3379 family protein [Betaproteobacteria bacterium]
MLRGNPLNCVEVHRQLLVDPRRAGSEAMEHRKSCAACAEYSAHLARMESELATAACVPVPEALADRVLLHHELGNARAQNWPALAASLVLAVSLTVLITLIPLYKNPALAAIDHVLHDEPNELVAGRTGDSRVLAHILARSGLSIPADRVGVRYLGQCPFRDGIAYHVLLDTPFGKATLLVTPDKSLNARVVTSGQGLSAAVTPARSGSYALVADSSGNLARIEGLLKSPAL